MFNHFGLIIVFFINEFSQGLPQIRHFCLELHFYRLNQFINSLDLFFCRCKSPVGEENSIRKLLFTEHGNINRTPSQSKCDCHRLIPN